MPRHAGGHVGGRPWPVAGLLPGPHPGLVRPLSPLWRQPARRGEHAPARAQALRALPGALFRLRAGRPPRRAAGLARPDRVGPRRGAHARGPAEVELRPRGPRMTRRIGGCLMLLLGGSVLVRAAEPEVRVVLWFDTEDYLLPASDDAARRVAEILTARGIRATFKLVGEKARVLEQRGRADVIAALGRHDIGYHSNLHSVHPTPAEYLSRCGWLDGVAEFSRRESAGARDVRRIFGLPGLSCYGQPGSSWGPQAHAALKQIGVVTAAGVPVYLDEGTNVGFEERPFWFAGVLNVYAMGRNQTRMELHEPGGIEKGCAAFKAAYDRLRGEGGGLI